MSLVSFIIEVATSKLQHIIGYSQILTVFLSFIVIHYMSSTKSGNEAAELLFIPH